MDMRKANSLARLRSAPRDPQGTISFLESGHARRSIGNYSSWNKQNRPHSRLADQTPDEA
ncbi:hypothetical protein GNZ13_28790 [Paraburkholderia sp. 5N]|uniref:Uncharacterized protein n=1 Tax=Paraburkholderia elongata TaxID=2675747 RepID=A0A972NRS6_9BURK|nr:hypothetical protein [Paraburkholderia elongata]